mgnify:CR=1 FL=1
MRNVSLAVIFATLALVGCSTQRAAQTSVAGSTSSVASSANTAPAAKADAGAAQQLTAEQQAKQAAEKAGLVVYFDFDSSDIKPEFSSLIAAHAKYLATNSNLKVRLEGNTDERGSREYNVGLGERRAQSVRRALLLQGVGEAQVTTLSYGEERPAVSGNDEAAYAKNRRVEFGY